MFWRGRQRLGKLFTVAVSNPHVSGEKVEFMFDDKSLSSIVTYHYNGIDKVQGKFESIRH